MESKSSAKLGRTQVQHHFFLHHVFFTQQSISEKNQNVRNILIGDNSNDFYEIIQETSNIHKKTTNSVDNDTNPFTLKLFGNDYQKKRAKLSRVTHRHLNATLLWI